MVYLDYAANTPVDKEVLDNYIETTKKYMANPNSSHLLGKKAKEEIDRCSSKIGKYFNTDKESIIYTSGASESNNLVIKGIAFAKKDIGKHIIISSIEHSSIIAPCNYLTDLGYEVDIIPILETGQVDLEKLKELIREDTILVSITSVDSELGTIQPIQEIVKIIQKYPNCSFHTDATQAIGKTNINFEGVDFLTFAPHKFFGINGVGILINFNKEKLIPLIHGGKSTTIYRSGTPVIANVTSSLKALELALDNLSEREKYLKELNAYLRKELSLKYIHINSPSNSIYNTLNISLFNIDNKVIIKELEKDNIYLSTTSACTLDSIPSKSVLAITKDIKLAKNSIRISISHLTTKKELEIFINKFKKVCDKYANN